jgi:hypothetical protein
MKTLIYKTGIIAFLLLCTQAPVHSKNWNEDIYENPFGEINGQFESLPNSTTPFGDELAYQEMLAPEYDAVFTTSDDPNDTGEPELGLIVPAGTVPLGFTSCCLLLYGIFCLIRVRKKLLTDNQQLNKNN